MMDRSFTLPIQIPVKLSIVWVGDAYSLKCTHLGCRDQWWTLPWLNPAACGVVLGEAIAHAEKHRRESQNGVAQTP